MVCNQYEAYFAYIDISYAVSTICLYSLNVFVPANHFSAIQNIEDSLKPSIKPSFYIIALCAILFSYTLIEPLHILCNNISILKWSSPKQQLSNERRHRTNFPVYQSNWDLNSLIFVIRNRLLLRFHK